MQKHVVLRELKRALEQNGSGEIPQKFVNNATLSALISSLETQDEIHQGISDLKTYLVENPTLSFVLRHKQKMAVGLGVFLLMPYLLPLMLHFDSIKEIVVRILGLVL